MFQNLRARSGSRVRDNIEKCQRVPVQAAEARRSTWRIRFAQFLRSQGHQDQARADGVYRSCKGVNGRGCRGGEPLPVAATIEMNYQLM
jgi:hypothetical protein